MTYHASQDPGRFRLDGMLRNRNRFHAESPAQTSPLVVSLMAACAVAFGFLVAGYFWLGDSHSESGPPQTVALGDLDGAAPLQITGLTDPSSTGKAGTDATPATELAVAEPTPAALEARLADIAPAAGPTAPALTGPRLVLILTEVGEDSAASQAAIAALPAGVTLGLSPYGKGVRALADLARRDGHEVLTGLPMQPRAWPRLSPGPNTLLVGQTAADLRQRVDWALGQTGATAGVYTMMGSAFTASRPDYAGLLKLLKDRNVTVVDARSTALTLGPDLARELDVRLVLNQRFIEGSDNEMQAALDALAHSAHAKGMAIGLLKATPQSVALLKSWLPEIDRLGVQLAPVSALPQS